MKFYAFSRGDLLNTKRNFILFAAINFVYRVQLSGACPVWLAGVSKTAYDIRPTVQRMFAIARKLIASRLMTMT